MSARLNEQLKKLASNTMVRKRDGSLQLYDPGKMYSSIQRAGASREEAELVTSRVTSRASKEQEVPSTRLSTMVSRSLGQVNKVASESYRTTRDRKYLPTRRYRTTGITSSYGRLAMWIKSNYGSRFRKGSTTEEVKQQLERVLRERERMGDFRDNPAIYKGFRAYIDKKEYGDLVRIR